MKESILEAAEGKFIRYEVELQGAGDNTRFFDFSINPIFDRDGKVTLLVPEARDITDRKMAEEALRESRKQYRNLVEGTPDLVTRVDAEGRFLFVNHSAQEIYGLKPEACLGRVAFDFIHPEDRKTTETAFKNWLKGDMRVFTHENRMIGVDGSVHFLAWSICPEYDENGKVSGFASTAKDITDRKRVEEALRLKNFVFDASIAAKSIADLAGVITEANNAFLQIWGYSSKDEVIGKHVTYFLIDLNEAVSIIRELDENGKWQGIYAAKKKDGTSFIAHGIATLLRDENGKVIGYQSSVMDITERKQTEEALRVSEFRYRELVNLAVDGILVGSHEGIITEANECMCTMAGRSRDELVGKHITILFHPEILDKVPLRFDLLQKGETVVSERTIIRPDSSAVDVEMRTKMMPDGSYQSIYRDITERKKAEEEARRSRQFSDSVINSLPGMFYVIDSNGKLIRVNENFLKVSSYSMEEVLAMQALDFFSAEEKEKVGSRIKEAFENGESSVEAEFISEDGKKTPYYFTGYCANIDNAKLLVGLGIDITERKKAESAREEMEERLRQSQKMEAIGQLAGGIAHDFNNQLMGIMGYAELLCNRLDDPTLRNDAESILRASRRASDLTKDLLAFSRKGKYLTVPVNVNKIIEEVISLLEHSIDKRIEIRRVLSASPVMILGDPTQLQNSLLNLAINAKDALPSGGEIVFTTENVMMEDVFTTPEERSKAVKGRYMRICVIDDGIGMDDDTKKHLFEPFFTTKQPGKGTGMGLASVYGTVKSHNGVIYVDSKIGEGTVFSLYFPLIEDNTDLDRPEARTERAVRTSSILLVDDEEDVRTIISRILRSLGHTVVTCRDGQEAVEYYRQSWKSLDLVILDMMMPRMNGRDAFFEMQKINKDIRALLISGFSIDGEAQNLLDTGMKGFIQKPFNMKMLAKTVDETLKK